MFLLPGGTASRILLTRGHDRTRLLRDPGRRAQRDRRRHQARLSQARPAVASRRQHRPGGPRTVQGDQRGLPGPVRSGAPPALRHVRAGRGRRRRRGRRRCGRLRRVRRLLRHLRRVLRWRRRGRLGAARSTAARRRPALRPADHVRGGGQGDREGDRVLRPPAVRDVPRQRRQGGQRADHLPPVQWARRGPLGAPDDARPDGQRERLSALPWRGQDHRDAVRDLPRRRPHRTQAHAAGDDPGRASTRVTRSGSRTRARSGRAVGRRAACTSRSTSCPIRAWSARGRSCSTRPRSRSPRPRSGRGSRSRPSRARKRSRSRPGTQPDSEIRLRGRGVPHLRRSGQRGDLHVLVDVVVPTKLSKKQRDLLAAYARNPARRSATAAVCSRSSGWVEPRRRRRRRRLAGARGRGRRRSGRGGQRDPRPGGARRDLGRARVRADRRGPGRPARSDPARHRPRLPAGPRPSGRRPRRGARWPRRSATSRRSACARSASSGSRVVDEADWAEAWKAYFPVLRVGRRLVIRPTWRRHRREPGDVVLALDPGMAFGTGPASDDAPVPRGHRRRSRTAGVLAGARVLDVGCGSGILAIAAVRLGAATALGVDTDPIAIEATLANARRNRLVRRHPARDGSLPSGERAVRRRARQPHRRAAGAARAGAPRRASPGRHAPRVGHLRRPRGRGPRRRSRPPACVVDGRRAEGDWVALEAHPAGAERAPAPTIGRDAVLLPAPARRAHHPRGQPRPALHPAAVRAADPAGDGRVGQPASSRACSGRRATARSSIGLGLALTGIGLVASLGSSMLQQPWLLLALTIYFVNLAIAFFIQRPNLRRLVGVRAAADDNDLAGARPAAALRVVPDGRAGRHDRVPDELQAGAVVTPARGAIAAADCLFCRIVAGEIPPTRLHDDDLVIAIRDIAPRAPTHILLMPAPPHRLGGGADRRRRAAARAAVRGRRRPGPDGGHRRRRLPARHERRALGRPDGRPPPCPPDGRAAVRLAARDEAGQGLRARSVLAVASVAFVLVAAGCATTEHPVGGPAARRRVGPGVTVTPAVGQTRGAIVAALGAQNLDAAPTARPPSARPRRPCSATAPRAVYQVHPAEGPDTRASSSSTNSPTRRRAAAAAAEQQAYLGTGPAGSSARRGP